MGPNPKVNKKIQLRIKRAMCSLQDSGEKITSRKIVAACDLDMSISTVQRHLKSKQWKYKRATAIISLTNAHKAKRVASVTSWIENQQCWEKTVFSDEKRFSLDGPDDWRSYVPISQKLYRSKRQCGGGSILLWLLVLPNGLLSYRVIQGNLDADKYIDLLRTTAVPMMKLNYGDDFMFQEDNAPVHKAGKVKHFMIASNIKVLDWPPKSPDLNITEDVWKLVSDAVYDGPPFENKAILLEKISNVITYLNQSKRHVIKNLFATIRSRLCKVLLRNGEIINK